MKKFAFVLRSAFFGLLVFGSTYAAAQSCTPGPQCVDTVYVSDSYQADGPGGGSLGGAANGGASLGGGGGGAPAQPPNVSRYIYTGQGTDNTSSVTAVNAAGRDAAEGNLSQGQAFGLVENGSPTTYWIWYGPGVVKRIG